MGRYDEAIAEFQKVKESNPAYLPARIHLGVTFYTQARREEALAEWEEVLLESPDNKSCKLYVQLVNQEMERDAQQPPLVDRPPSDD